MLIVRGGHHALNTEVTISEASRVLKLGGGLKGRGREKVFLDGNVGEVARLYDGAHNPLGKGYTRAQFEQMLEKHFDVVEVYINFFPVRSFPIIIPAFVHDWLDKYLGFMIYATVQKTCAD